MRIVRILSLGAAIILPQLALAELPFGPEMLARLDGATDMCAKEKPEVAQKLKDQSKLLFKDVSDKELEDARSSDDYKAARKTVDAELAKLKKEEAAKSCSEIFGSKK